jgi:G3E family GTPase
MARASATLRTANPISTVTLLHYRAEAPPLQFHAHRPHHQDDDAHHTDFENGFHGSAFYQWLQRTPRPILRVRGALRGSTSAAFDSTQTPQEFGGHPTHFRFNMVSPEFYSEVAPDGCRRPSRRDS